MMRQAIFEGDKVRVSLNYKVCINCGLCITHCPHEVLVWQENVFEGNKCKVDSIGISDISKCDGCRKCEKACKAKAITIH